VIDRAVGTITPAPNPICRISDSDRTAAERGRSVGENVAVNRYVLFYESADDVLSKAPAVFPQHLARLQEFKARGELLMVGTFADPQADGSMAIFASRDGAESFATGDPFVLQGVVRSWAVKEWFESSGDI
jgi:uncharacterized protein YciI